MRPRRQRPDAPRPPPAGGADVGQLLARLICALFALIGAVPLTGGYLLQSAPLHEWAANETARLMREHLGVEATYSVEMSLWPLRLAVNDVVIPATDGQGDALVARTVAVKPRFFSLLAGRIDVGDIELEEARARLVLRDGEITNVAYHLPETSDDTAEMERAPFKSLAVTDLRVDLDIDGTQLKTGPIDLDLFAEPQLEFDVALRMAEASLTSRRVDDTSGTSVDEDEICRVDLRARLTRDSLLVRRLSFLGAADLDAAEGTRPSCATLVARAGEESSELDDSNDHRVALRLSQVRLTLPEGMTPRVQGHVMVRVPLGLTSRYVDSPSLRGWAGFTGDLAFDGSRKLPELDGQLSGARIGLDEFEFAKRVDAEVHVSQDVIQVPELQLAWADGQLTIESTKISPFDGKAPLSIGRVRAKEVSFPGLMRDLGITPDTIVRWDLDDVEVENVRGTLSPFYIDGSLVADTSDFTVFDDAWHAPGRSRMVGVHRARVVSRFRAHSQALEFYGADVQFGKSHIVPKLVSIGFAQTLKIDIPEAAIDLADVGPLAGLEVHGRAKLKAALDGPMVDPVLHGDLSVEGFSMAGFEAGNIVSAKARFQPLHVDFTDAILQKGATEYRLPSARLSFDGPAPVSFDAEVESSRFGLRDFFEIWHFDEDPRFADISGKGSTKASIHYVLGGPEDTCGGGNLTVNGRIALAEADLFGEHFDGAESDFSFHWLDMPAGDQGMAVDVTNLTLRKGAGSVIGSLRVSPGAKLSGNFIGSRIPLSKVTLFEEYSSRADGFISGAGQVGGTLSAIEVDTRLQVSPIELEGAVFPASSLTVKIEPVETPSESVGKSGCGRPIGAPFDLAKYQQDRSSGDFVIDGQLFGKQVEMRDLRITQQRDKRVSGELVLSHLDLEPLLHRGPSEPDGERLGGALSGRLRLEEYYPERPFSSRAVFTVTSAHLERSGFSLELESEGPAEVRLENGTLAAKNFAASITTPTGERGIFDATASLKGGRTIESSIVLRDTDLGALSALLPGVERGAGVVRGRLDIRGPVASPDYSGQIEVERGELALRSLDTPITNLNLLVELSGSNVVIRRGEAALGGGTLRLSGGFPIVGNHLGRGAAELQGRGINLPLGTGIEVGVDADLRIGYAPSNDKAQTLPRITGTVDILHGHYRRPMAVTADIAELTARGRKTQVDSYDPARDVVELDVLVRSTNPLSVENDLVDAEVRVDSTGLRVSGTDQRFGAVGAVNIVKGGRIHLRRNEFDIQQGIVRFNDPNEIEPQVDVVARTEFRRYDDPDRSDTGTDATSQGSSTGAPLGGNWRINLHAYGPPEDLKVDLTSDPALAQDDIFLLLTVGLTRAELDQTRSAGVGSSVALEALGTLSGADQALTDAVPVIDEFRFGSAYSSRTGRTEPTVTIGKRLSQRIRAAVTTSLSDTSEVRSNVEWRVSQRVSVEASYDNVKDIGAPVVGNVGGDVRWRLEFE